MVRTEAKPGVKPEVRDSAVDDGRAEPRLDGRADAGRQVRPLDPACRPAVRDRVWADGGGHPASLRHHLSEDTGWRVRRRRLATKRAPIRALTEPGSSNVARPDATATVRCSTRSSAWSAGPIRVLVEHPAHAGQVDGGQHPGAADADGEVVVVGLQREVDPAVEAP